MASTQAELDRLIAMRNSGILSTGHGDKRVQFRSLAELNQAIAAIRRELASSRPANHGLARTRRGI